MVVWIGCEVGGFECGLKCVEVSFVVVEVDVVVELVDLVMFEIVEVLNEYFEGEWFVVEDGVVEIGVVCGNCDDVVFGFFKIEEKGMCDFIE